MGTQLPPQKRGQSPPQFSAHFYCGQTVGCIKMPFGMEVGLSPGEFVRWGPSPLPKKRESPQFTAHVYCGQTAAWIKIPLSMEVGLGPDDTVLDGDPAPPPQFSAHVYCGQMAGWIKMALGTEVVPGPGHIVLDWDPAPSPKMGGAPNFRPTCIVAKQLHGSRCHLVWSQASAYATLC